MNNLPDELLSLIVNFLDLASAFSMSQVLTIDTFYSKTIYDDRTDIVIDAISNGYTTLFKWLEPDPTIVSPCVIKQYRITAT